jgi:hypothetical protein
LHAIDEPVAHASTRIHSFPIEREPADAWADFVGWRINHEQAAYALAADVDAVPAKASHASTGRR